MNLMMTVARRPTSIEDDGRGKFQFRGTHECNDHTFIYVNVLQVQMLYLLIDVGVTKRERGHWKKGVHCSKTFVSTQSKEECCLRCFGPQVSSAECFRVALVVGQKLGRFSVVAESV